MNGLENRWRAREPFYRGDCLDGAAFSRQRVGHLRRAVTRLHDQGCILPAKVRGTAPGGILSNCREWLFRARLYPPPVASRKENDFFVPSSTADLAFDLS